MKISVRWLRELCPVDLDDDQIAAALTSAGLEVESPDLMRARHRDVQVAAVPREVPRRAERDLLARDPVHRRDVPELARARDGGDRLAIEVDAADGVVPRVGDVERSIVEADALRVVERGVRAAQRRRGRQPGRLTG